MYHHSIQIATQMHETKEAAARGGWMPSIDFQIISLECIIVVLYKYLLLLLLLLLYNVHLLTNGKNYRICLFTELYLKLTELY